MVDISVAGHLTSLGGLSTAAFIGGISIGSILFDLLYWNFAFLRASTGGLVSQAFGRNDMKECARLFTRSVGLALLLSIFILLIQWPFQKLAFLVVKCSPEVQGLALKYFLLRIWAAPATLSLMAFRGWFVGMQDTMSSMLTDLVVNVVNIACSIILTLGIGSWKGIGFAGIAIGTVIAQYSGLFFAILVTMIKYGKSVFINYGLEDIKSSIKGAELRKFMSMNGDLFVRSLCFIAIYFGFTTLAARYGDLMLSASTIIMKILMLFSYFTDGFAYAGEALTGKFIGAKDYGQMRSAVKYVFIWSMAIACLFMIFYGFAGKWLITLMTSDNSVIAACIQFLPWLLLMPPFGCAAFTWDGIYEGATDTRDVRNAMIVAFIAFYIVYFLGINIFKATGNIAMNVLMAAYFAHLLARTLMLSFRWKHVKRVYCEETEL